MNPHLEAGPAPSGAGAPRSPSAASSPAARGESPGAVLLTRDRVLAEHVAALAEAAGSPLTVLASPGPALHRARLALVGLDVAAELAPAARSVVLVVRVEGTDPPDGVWRQAVEMGAEHVALLPEGEPWLVRRLVDAAGPAVAAPVIGVVGGCGGAGASSLAMALAVTAEARGRRCVLMDADPLGGGLDLPLGVDLVPGVRWPDLPFTAGRVPAGVIGSGLPAVGDLRVLACGRGEVTALPPEVLGAAVEAAARESDLVVVDLPRHLGEAEAVVLVRCALVLLVVPSSLRAAAAAGLVATAVEPFARDLRVVVRGPMIAGCEPQAVADALMLPLEGELRPEPGHAAALEAGEALALRPRGPLGRFCRHVLDDVLEPA